MVMLRCHTRTPRLSWWPTVRSWLNWVNGSTLAGRWLARRTGTPLTPGPRGVWVAGNYPPVFPAHAAGAVTIGDVVLSRLPAAELINRPALFAHEAAHCDQWALLGIPGFLPAYLLSGGWSWLRTGCTGRFNVFEKWAGLADGGYDPHRRCLPRGATAATIYNVIRLGHAPATPPASSPSAANKPPRT